MSLMIDEVHKLLSIAELSGKWPHLRPVHDAAMRVLAKHAEGAAKDNAAALKEEQEAAARAKAEADAKAKAVIDKEEAETKAKVEAAKKPATTDFNVEASSQSFGADVKRRAFADDTAEDRKE